MYDALDTRQRQRRLDKRNEWNSHQRFSHINLCCVYWHIAGSIDTCSIGVEIGCRTAIWLIFTCGFVVSSMLCIVTQNWRTNYVGNDFARERERNEVIAEKQRKMVRKSREKKSTRNSVSCIPKSIFAWACKLIAAAVAACCACLFVFVVLLVLDARLMKKKCKIVFHTWSQ